ncbi:hypothetical protein [Aureliella helgolandensis]|uniref:DUF1232 domain-containing protein n=1 Tax=Aureliella helgolandensis TaxID=2527968 RepID=A0A518G9N3_9BACT|nr:hypothetical protein [Aureliella helgolandensis]QDV25304.1 hypothetical protein Q31a_36280 [Aureliella helgolandensis]
MPDDPSLFPTGISRHQLESLSSFADSAQGASAGLLLSQAEEHAKNAEVAYLQNAIVNRRLAIAILDSIQAVLSRWSELPESYKYWLGGAIRYFVSSNDEEPDFNSPIGFEDDVEVLNACLRFARLNDLCLAVEDYDDA